MIEKTLISVNFLLEDTASDGTDGSLNIEGGCVSRPSDEPMEKMKKNYDWVISHVIKI